MRKLRVTRGHISVEAWRRHCIHHCFGCMAGSTGPRAPFERATWIAPLSEKPFSHFHLLRLVSPPNLFDNFTQQCLWYTYLRAFWQALLVPARLPILSGLGPPSLAKSLQGQYVLANCQCLTDDADAVFSIGILRPSQ